MHPEKYTLTWHTYSDHLRSMMKELMMNEDFSDITLVTEDKKQIKANINILRLCSPVFKDILKKEQNSNQIMYLRGVQFTEMESIMQFIYLGEATFYEERMDEFLAVAKSLEIKELCNAETEVNNEPDDGPSTNDQDTPTEMVGEQTVISDEMNLQRLKRQRRGVNINGSYECDQCHKAYSRQDHLTTHIKSKHEGIKYACDQCDFQATQQGNLAIHIQSKHEGIKYACGQCDYQATQQGNLARHIQSKHEGVKYPCDQCDFQSNWKQSLTEHIQSKHEGVMNSRASRKAY